MFVTQESALVTVTVFEFGDFTLDLDRFELCRNGCRLKLERKPMELLILLAASKGSLVTRTEIAQRLWDSEVYVDTEHGINTAIRKIRQVLDDDPEEPRFVQTVTGKGYRFIGTLAEPPPTAEDEASDESAESNHTGDTQALASSAPVAFIPALTPAPANPEVPSENESWKFPRLGMLFWVAALGGLAALILVFSQSSRGFLSRFLHRQTQSPTGLKIASLAVLPLDNLSGDPRQEYFADGMTDELTTMLAKNSTLRIVSRTSVMQYKGVHRPLPEIARALGVDGVLEGSISRSGDKVHMTIQLIHAPSDTHLWAESYDRDRNDVASLPREAAMTIAKRLNGAVLQSTPQRYVSRKPTTPTSADGIIGLLERTTRTSNTSRKRSNCSPTTL
jgi:TolB-like protein/DNA-binding winged helix-turn-helix (wHTH) protein